MNKALSEITATELLGNPFLRAGLICLLLTLIVLPYLHAMPGSLLALPVALFNSARRWVTDHVRWEG
jgi:hypothetical protein